MAKQTVALIVCTLMATAATGQTSVREAAAGISTIPLTIVGTDTTPRIDGSTSAQPLLALLACRAVGVPCAMRTAFGDPPLTFRPADPFKAPDYLLRGKPAASGTGEAYRRLIRRDTDLILVARRPSAEEQALARENRVSLRVEQIAWDGLVFIANAKNPAQGLRLDAIRSLYAGKLLRWSEAGGQGDSLITPLVRNSQSGSQQLFYELVSPAVAPSIATGHELMTMTGMVDMVGSRPDDLGFSVFYYMWLRLDPEAQKRAREGLPYTGRPPEPSVKMLAIDGVIPDRATIADGRYPLRSGVFAVIRDNEATRAPTPLLLEWFLGPAGQTVVAESGYVPLRAAK